MSKQTPVEESKITHEEFLSGDYKTKARYMNEQIIGNNMLIDTPIGTKIPILYCDFTASGKPLEVVEKAISENVLPFYANTHTTTSITGAQTSLFVSEAREIVKKCLNCSKDDCIIFSGSGSTSGAAQLLHIMDFSKYKHLSEDEKNCPVVINGPFEHHSNILPWKEAGCKLVRLGLDSKGAPCYKKLEELCKIFREQSKTRLLVGSFNASSNVSGVILDLEKCARIIHKYNGIIVADFSASAPYMKIDMNPKNDPQLAMDASFFSPHKFLGGPQTTGMLIAKKKLFRNKTPTRPGGGTVYFVTDDTVCYHKKDNIINIEMREQGGTPGIIGIIRVGLTLKIKDEFGVDLLRKREEVVSQKVISRLSKLKKLKLLGGIDAERLPVFSFLISHGRSFLNGNFVSALLNDFFGIQSRGGCSCAGPYVLSQFGVKKEFLDSFVKVLPTHKGIPTKHLRPGFSRLNFHYVFDDETVEYILKAIEFVHEHGWKFLPLYEIHLGGNVQFRDFYHPLKLLKNIFGKEAPKPKYLNFGELEKAREDIFKNTLSFINKKVEEIKKGSFVYEKTESDSEREILFKDPEIKKLRWFVLPEEVIEEIKNQDYDYPDLPKNLAVTMIPIPDSPACEDELKGFTF